jgi:hypothetical protein
MQSSLAVVAGHINKLFVNNAVWARTLPSMILLSKSGRKYWTRRSTVDSYCGRYIEWKVAFSPLMDSSPSRKI